MRERELRWLRGEVPTQATQAFLPSKAKVVDGFSVRGALDRGGSSFFERDTSGRAPWGQAMA